MTIKIDTGIRYKFINKYSNQQENEFFDSKEAEEYLKQHQKIGTIGMLKGKEVFKIRKVDLNKNRISSLKSRNRLNMRKEWFGV